MSKKSSGTKAARDNRANQLNPNHPAYWSSRGEEAPPPKAPLRTTENEAPTSSPAHPPAKKG